MNIVSPNISGHPCKPGYMVVFILYTTSNNAVPFARETYWMISRASTSLLKWQPYQFEVVHGSIHGFNTGITAHNLRQSLLEGSQSVALGCSHKKWQKLSCEEWKRKKKKRKAGERSSNPAWSGCECWLVGVGKLQKWPCTVPNPPSERCVCSIIQQAELQLLQLNADNRRKTDRWMRMTEENTEPCLRVPTAVTIHNI